MALKPTHARAERGDEMGTVVLLEYPNGRTHEAEVPEELKPGAEFELFGRRWRSLYRLPPPTQSRYAEAAPPRLLCRPDGSH
jgi:hypothetical protein